MRKVYAVKLKNKKDLMLSSSGGVFTAITDFYLNNNDYVMSSIYNYEKNELEFVIYNDIETRNSARGSKYFQSKVGNSFKDAIKLLKDNPEKKLVFFGMGCQAEGFRKLCELSKVRSRVFVVDIICTGNPSAKLWKSYISQYKNISYVSFKDKRNGWINPTAIAISDGKEIDISDWLSIFYSHNGDKPSCANCPFATVDRNVDMTIGDFWGIETNIPDFYDKYGNSVVLVHSSLGEQMMKNIDDKVDYVECDLKFCKQKRLYYPPEKSLNYNRFWKDYQIHGIKYVLKKYKKDTLYIKILKRIRKLLNNKKISRWRKNEK